MWETNKDIQHLYATHNAQQVWAIFSGLSGWKRVSPDSPDGVSNVATLLSTAKTHGRKVSVYVNNDEVERAWML